MTDPVKDISVGADGQNQLDVLSLTSQRPDSNVLPPASLPVYAEAKRSFLSTDGYGVGLANDLTQGILGQALETPDSFKVRNCVAELLAEHLVAQEDFLEAWKKSTAGEALQCLRGGRHGLTVKVQADFSPTSTVIAPGAVKPEILAALADSGFNINSMKPYHEHYDRLGTKYWLIGRLLAESKLPRDERVGRNSLYVRTLRIAAANGLVDEGIIGEAASIVSGFADRMAFNLGDPNFNPSFSEHFLTWAGNLQDTTIPLLTTAPAEQFFGADAVAGQARDLLAQRIQSRRRLTPR